MARKPTVTADAEPNTVSATVLSRLDRDGAIYDAGDSVELPLDEAIILRIQTVVTFDDAPREAPAT